MISIANRYKKRKIIDNISNILLALSILILMAYYFYLRLLLINSSYFAEARIEKFKSNKVEYSFVVRENWNFRGVELITSKQYKHIKSLESQNLLVQYDYFHPDRNRLYNFHTLEDIFRLICFIFCVFLSLIIFIYPFITIEYIFYIIACLPILIFTNFTSLYLELLIAVIIPSIYYLCKKARLQHNGVFTKARIIEIEYYKENWHQWAHISYSFNIPEYPYPVNGTINMLKKKCNFLSRR